ncbi:MAG: hypothetical protein HXS54_04140 [Theionarchaea archaeon]|nr:hypothetical protein [Theionarchaea archaeon]
MRNTDLSDREKGFLTTLGKYPDVPMKQLLTKTQYRRVSSLIKKIGQFRRQNIYCGPYIDIDFGKLCKNPVRLAICVVESEKSFETVLSYLEVIESLQLVYPVLPSHKVVINILSISSDNQEMASLFQLLKDNNIISDYIIRYCSQKRNMENPNFFGDPDPSLENILTPCDIPDMSLGSHDTTWSECDIHILPYLQMGYKGLKLIEILREERKLNNKWTYDQIKYSHKKMLSRELIMNRCNIYPFSYDQCVDFNLFLKCEDVELTQTAIYNLARNARVLREYMLFQEWGFMGFVSHPLFLTGLMHKLNQINEITEKELYQISSIPDRKSFFTQPIELKYFDFEKQTLQYPYDIYKEKIKENLEQEI